MDFFTVAGVLWKAVVAVPALGVGILIGGFGYRYLLKSNPTMLNNLVALATKEIEAVAAKASTDAAVVPTPTDTPK